MTDKITGVDGRTTSIQHSCATCGNRMTRDKVRQNAKYCGTKCQRRAAYLRRKEQLALAGDLASEIESGDEWTLSKGRSGKLLRDITAVLSDAEYQAWLAQGLSDAEVASRVQASRSGVYRARIAAVSHLSVAELSVEWEMEPEFAAMLGPSDIEMRQAIGDDSFDDLLDEAMIAFRTFRHRWFQYQPGRPFITRDFHIAWMRDVLDTIYTGGRTMILSPPRHGKSELLVHFCIWLIIRNPDIRILWIGPNDDISQVMLQSVRDTLAENQELKEAFLAPDQTWRPSAREGVWAGSKFTVRTRTRHQKQPTMWCTGVGGRIHSLDCDVIVVDDPEDPDNTMTPGQREKTKTWFRIKVATRKMMWTGLIIISSRVHVDDLYSLFLDSSDWKVRVDKAHDRAICGLDIEDEHDRAGLDDDGHLACVLFSELNPYSYLLEQLSTVGRPLFEMMYLNQPRPEGSLIFDPDIIREECLDFSRGLGLPTLKDGFRLVAGLDPAARSTQAAFLWAVPETSDTVYMVDLETQRGGGPEGAVRIMEQWRQDYGCEIWLVEDNGYQKSLWQFEGIRRLKQSGMTIEPTHTGMNKHDPDFGVAGMAPVYHEGKINLPYTDLQAQRKVDLLIRELTLFTDDITKQRRNQSDILMAHWFPWSRVIKKWIRRRNPVRQKIPTGISYPTVTGLNSFNQAPWGKTNYPGGR